MNKIKLKIPFLTHTSHISSTRDLHTATVLDEVDLSDFFIIAESSSGQSWSKGPKNVHSTYQEELEFLGCRKEATDHMDASTREMTPEQHKSKLNYVKKRKKKVF